MHYRILASLLLFAGCEPPTTYEPCAGKACGESCAICAPDDPDCVETAQIKVCDPNGVCSGAASMCGATGTGTEGEDSGGDTTDAGTDTGTYEPCADKVCGDVCSACDPDDPDCVETGEEKACDPNGDCVSNTGDLCGACMPATDDPGSLDTDCMADADCPDGYVCQDFIGFALTQTCQIPCVEDCECPAGLNCTVVSDKAGSWTQCGN